MKCLNTSLCRVLVIILCSQLCAWSYSIHRSVVEEVEKQLQPSTLHKLYTILGSGSLAEHADWADRQTLYPRNWHYVSYDAIGKPCLGEPANLFCALEDLIQPSSQILSMPSKDRLRLILHLVVDAHQPLHVDKPHFTNPGCFVRVPQKMSIHKFMDGVVFGKKQKYLAQLLAKERRYYTLKPSLSVELWLDENKGYWDMIYPHYEGEIPYYCKKNSRHLPKISLSKQAHITKAMIHRLATASERLTAVLEQIYGVELR